jgi:hypothetical protein
MPSPFLPRRRADCIVSIVVGLLLIACAFYDLIGPGFATSSMTLFGKQISQEMIPYATGGVGIFFVLWGFLWMKIVGR